MGAGALDEGPASWDRPRSLPGNCLACRTHLLLLLFGRQFRDQKLTGLTVLGCACMCSMRPGGPHLVCRPGRSACIGLVLPALHAPEVGRMGVRVHRADASHAAYSLSFGHPEFWVLPKRLPTQRASGPRCGSAHVRGSGSVRVWGSVCSARVCGSALVRGSARVRGS